MAAQLVGIKALIIRNDGDEPLFLELTRSPNTIYPSEGDLPGGVFDNEKKETPVMLIQRVLQEQISLHVSTKNLVLLSEWTMAGRPSEYIYCALVDNPAIKIASKISDYSAQYTTFRAQYTAFRWFPLYKIGTSNLLPALKEIILTCEKEINKVLEQEKT